MTVELDKTVNKLKASAVYTHNGTLVAPAFNNTYTTPDPIDITLAGLKTLTGGGKTTAGITEGQFSFSVERTDGNGLQVTGLPEGAVAVKAGGDIDFGAWTFADAGTYSFTISENDAPAGYTKAPPVYVTVDVTLNTTKNVLEKAISYKTAAGADTALAFANTYAPPEAVTVPITGAKTLTGGGKTTADIAAEQFGFTVKRADSNGFTVGGLPAGTVYAAAATGALDFGEWSFEKAGVYSFTVSENDVPAGYTRAPDVTLDIEVSIDPATNAFKTSLSYSGGSTTGLNFKNSYSYPEPVSLPVTENKTLSGFNNAATANITKDQFTFTVTPGENNPKDGVSGLPAGNIGTEAGGSLSFGEWSFSLAGDYSFTISENEPPAGYTKAADVTMTVKVTIDSKTNTLVPAVSYTGGSTLTFANIYNAPTTTAQAFSGVKTLTENGQPKDIEEGQFEVHIVAAEANDSTGYKNFAAGDKPVAADGSFAFDEITFTKSGTYSFIITEKDLRAAGYSYDGSAVTATVKVGLRAEDNSLFVESLVYAKDGGGAELAFANTYEPPAPDEVTVSGVKLLKEGDADKSIEADQFSFSIAAAAGNNTDGYTGFTPGSVNVTANGGFSFGKLSFIKEGVYGFKITEDDKQAAGYDYDRRTVLLTVTVTLDKTTNELKATPAYTVDGTEAELSFENSYTTPEPVSVELTGAKTLTGNRQTEDIKAGEFVFSVTPDAGNNTSGYSGLKKTANVKAGGAIDFGSLSFTAEGEYKFTISENDLGKTGYTYDKTKYLLTVKITLDKETNTLVPKTVLEKTGAYANTEVEEISFANKYVPTPVKADPPVRKAVEGKPTVGGDFTFTLKADDSAFPMPEGSANGSKSVSVTGAGEVEFGEIEFTAEGIYSYTVTETKGNQTGYTYDDETYTIVFNVTDNDGSLECERSITSDKTAGTAYDSAVFTNVYTAPAESGKTNIPKTGDNSSVLLWLMTALASGMGICEIGLVSLKKKKAGKHS